MIENEKNRKIKITNCKWRDPKAAWVPILLVIIFGYGTITTFFKGVENNEIRFTFIALSLMLGTITICITYLILKRGQSDFASGILLLLCLAILLLVLPGITIYDIFGTVLVIFLIGLPVSYYWNTICTKTSG